MSADSEISVHARKRECGICGSMSAIGVDLESTNRNEIDNFVCGLCFRLAQLRKKVAQIKQEETLANMK
jgi:hypothetical protein